MPHPNQAGPSQVPLFLRLVTPQFTAGRITKLLPATPVTLILSTGRTGTVYLADLMNQLDSVTSVHEPKPSRVLNAWTTAYLEGRISDDYMAAALAAKRSKTLQDVQTSRYIESNNFIAGFADAAQAVFEDPTVIHIVRDPRDFVTSLTNRGDDAGIRGFFNRYVPYWAYLPPGVSKSQLTPLSRAAYRWVAINQYLDGYAERSAQYHRFRFEDIFGGNDQTELTRLLRAAGLTAKQIGQLSFDVQEHTTAPRFGLLDRPNSSANASKHQTMAKWRDWTADEKRTLASICGPLMDRYGYGDEPEWRQALS